MKDGLPEGSEIYIDSHQHFHMLPFIFRLIVELKDEFNVKYIRLPRERFFLDVNKDSIFNYLGSNLIKHFLLNFYHDYVSLIYVVVE